MWNTLLREHSRERYHSRLCFFYLFPLTHRLVLHALEAGECLSAFKIPDTVLYEQTVPGIFYC